METNKERFERERLACYARLNSLKNLSGNIFGVFAILGIVVAFLLSFPALVSGGWAITDWSSPEEDARIISGFSQPVAWGFSHFYIGFIIMGIGMLVSVLLYFYSKASFDNQLRRLTKSYIAGLTLEREYIMKKFTDIVTLIYFQGRNIRHLLRRGKKLDSKYVILRDSLAKNRYVAWNQIQPVREAALSAESGKKILNIFEKRFRLNMEEMITLYSQDGWRNGRYWLKLARKVNELSDSIDPGKEEKERQLIMEILTSSPKITRIFKIIDDLDEIRTIL